MSSFDRVTRVWGDLKYMDEARALYLRDLIKKNNCSDLLEIGFAYGKSSSYLAAILEDEGRGHLTTIDKRTSKKRKPQIGKVLAAVELSHRVTPIFAWRSYTWELAKMLEQAPRPQFDFCYFDGGHTWDQTGFGLQLVDCLLRPGGWIVFDDLDWTINKSMGLRKKRKTKARIEKIYSEDERAARGVRMVWELLLPRLGYRNLHEEKPFGWGVAQKPSA
jgi:predicted O-methyltransferase YrrM